MTVAEEIGIAGVEQLRIFAHEPAQAGMISSSTVFVELETSIVPCCSGCRVLSAGKQEAIVKGGMVNFNISAAVECGFAKHVVFVFFYHSSASIGEVRDAALMVLLVVKRPVVCRNRSHQNLVDPFAIEVPCGDGAV